MKKKIMLSILILLSSVCYPLQAQKRKQLASINSVKTKEIVSFKYNARNQLVYFDEKGLVTYREFTLKYDKYGLLSESVINQDKGGLVLSSKYTYDNEEYITEETKSSGRKTQGKSTESGKIYLDSEGRLAKTLFEDNKIWEEFEYNGNNIAKYTIHSASGDSDIVTTYEYNEDKSIFSEITNFPRWFFALHLNHIRWCGDFIGDNCPDKIVRENPKFDTETIKITYQYDPDGYPVKQFYNGELVKEFVYKTIW